MSNLEEEERKQCSLNLHKKFKLTKFNKRTFSSDSIFLFGESAYDVLISSDGIETSNPVFIVDSEFETASGGIA